MAWPGDRVQQMVIAKLSLRLSLPLEHMTWFNRILPQNERVREREREQKKVKNERRKKESKRASEFDAKQYLLGLSQV